EAYPKADPGANCAARGGTTPLHPPAWKGFAPPLPPHGRTRKNRAPPALWLGLKPYGCSGQGLRNPQPLALWLGLKPSDYIQFAVRQNVSPHSYAGHVTTLRDPLTQVLGKKASDTFDKVFGLRTVGDLLRHYPRRYY